MPGRYTPPNFRPLTGPRARRLVPVAALLASVGIAACATGASSPDTDAVTAPVADADPGLVDAIGLDAIKTDAALSASDAQLPSLDSAPGCADPSECLAGLSVCQTADCVSGACVFSVLPPGTTCRVASDVCDNLEVCDGVSPDCPADTLVAPGSECRPAAGTCDAAESCDGIAPACPVDSGVLALCEPSLPVVSAALGRTLTVEQVFVNNVATTTAEVPAGTSVTLRVTGNVVDGQASCDTCITQFYARIDGVFSLCLGSSTADWTFDSSTTFTAPTIAGQYFINPAASWEFSCVDTPSTSTVYSAGTIATIAVY